jgi:hypothetical protein
MVLGGSQGEVDTKDVYSGQNEGQAWQEGDLEPDEFMREIDQGNLSYKITTMGN